jgi:hypothetical protein
VPGGTQAVLPVLPDSSPYNPQAGDQGFFNVLLAKVPGGYDAIRPHVLSTDTVDIANAAGGAGQASFAFLVEPGTRTPVRGFTRKRR